MKPRKWWEGLEKEISLSFSQKDGVDIWLSKIKFQQLIICPFVELSTFLPHSICYSWFPKLKKAEGKTGMIQCPCAVYTLEHVKRIARRMIIK